MTHAHAWRTYHQISREAVVLQMPFNHKELDTVLNSQPEKAENDYSQKPVVTFNHKSHFSEENTRLYNSLKGGFLIVLNVFGFSLKVR